MTRRHARQPDSRARACSPWLQCCWPWGRGARFARRRTQLPVQRSRADAGSGVLSKLRKLAGEPEAEPEFLPPDQAFKVRVEPLDATTLVANFTPAEGYYLYRDKIAFAVPQETRVSRRPRWSCHAGRSRTIPISAIPRCSTGPSKRACTCNAAQRHRATSGWRPNIRAVPSRGCATRRRRRASISFSRHWTPLRPSSGGTASAPGTPRSVSPPLDETSRVAGLLRAATSGSPWRVFSGSACCSRSPRACCRWCRSCRGSSSGAGAAAHTAPRPRALGRLCAGHGADLCGRRRGGGAVRDACSRPRCRTPGCWAASPPCSSRWRCPCSGSTSCSFPPRCRAGLADASNRLQGGQLWGVFAWGSLSALIVGPCVAAPLAGALLYISQIARCRAGRLRAFRHGAGDGRSAAGGGRVGGRAAAPGRARGCER